MSSTVSLREIDTLEMAPQPKALAIVAVLEGYAIRDAVTRGADMPDTATLHQQITAFLDTETQTNTVGVAPQEDVSPAASDDTSRLL